MVYFSILSRFAPRRGRRGGSERARSRRRRRWGCESVYALFRECRSAQVQGVDKMLAVLENALEQYNESNAVMDLVLFEDAMKHIVPTQC